MVAQVVGMRAGVSDLYVRGRLRTFTEAPDEPDACGGGCQGVTTFPHSVPGAVGCNEKVLETLVLCKTA